MIPPELVGKRGWCCYLTQEQLVDDAKINVAIVEYSWGELGRNVEKVAGAVASLHFLRDEENEPDPEFP